MSDRVIHIHEGATYIEHQENNFHDQSQQVWNDATLQTETKHEDSNTIADKTKLLTDLLQFFYSDEKETCRFIDIIASCRPIDITNEVKRLVSENKVSDVSCHKPMWEVLNRYGLYTRSLDNWNKNIRP